MKLQLTNKCKTETEIETEKYLKTEITLTVTNPNFELVDHQLASTCHG